MFTFLQPKQRSLLGIDISSTSVKILELSMSAQPYHVKGYAKAPLPEGVIEGALIRNPDEVTEVIKRLLATHSSFSSKLASLAVPDSAVITKVIQVNEGMSDLDLEEFVTAESEKYIPYPIDEVNLDFELLGPSNKNPSVLDLLIVASRAENVNTRVELVEKAGLSAQVMDVESYAVERAMLLLAPDLPAEGKNKTIAVVDIGGVYTKLYVLHDMKIVFSREEEFGSRQLTEAIAERYGMSQKDAQIAREKGTLPQDYKKEVWTPFIEMMILQVKRALQFFFSTSHHTYIDKLLLAGGMGKQPGLSQLLEDQLNVPVMLVNPFSKMTIDDGVNHDVLFSDAPTLLIACGLAMRTWG